MNRAIRDTLILAGAAALLLAWSGAAQATAFRNPAPKFASGDIGLGAALSDDRETLFLDFALTDGGVLEGFIGNIDLPFGDDGTEVGVAYRHDIGEVNRIDGKPLHVGVLGRLHLGEADVGDVDQDYRQIDLGGGAAWRLTEMVDVYGLAVFHHVEVESLVVHPVTGKTVQAETDDSDYGLVIGGDLTLAASLLLGAELHFGIDNDDFAIYAEYVF